MPDPTTIEQLRADYARRHARDVKMAAARRFLAYLEVPPPGDVPLTYGGLLRRLQALIALELQHEGA